MRLPTFCRLFLSRVQVDNIYWEEWKEEKEKDKKKKEGGEKPEAG